MAQVDDGGISQAIVDKQALFTALHQRGLPQCLQMLRNARNGNPQLLRQRVDGALGLSQQFEELEPMRAGERLSNSRELRVQPVLEFAMIVDAHVYYSI